MAEANSVQQYNDLTNIMNDKRKIKSGRSKLKEVSSEKLE